MPRMHQPSFLQHAAHLQRQRWEVGADLLPRASPPMVFSVLCTASFSNTVARVGWAPGTAMWVPLGVPASHIGESGLQHQLRPPSHPPAPGRQEVMVPGAEGLPSPGRCGLSSLLLALTRPCTRCCRCLRRESTDGRALSTFLSLSNTLTK